MQRMLSTVLLGLRNLGRAPGRTGLTLLAVGFGVVAIIIAGGFVEWAYWALREAAIQTGLGHVHVSRSGYREGGVANPTGFLLSEESPQLTALRQIPEVRDIAPRLLVSGLVSRGETTVSFLGEGVDPEAEREASKLLAVVEGSNLSSTVPDEILLGRGLAATLGAAVGDRVVLLVKTSSGGVNALELRVRGLISRQVKAYDDAAVRLHVKTARELARLEGSHVWVVTLNRTEDTEAVAGRMRQLLPAGDFEVTSWRDLSDYYRSAVALFSRQVLVVEVIIGAIIVLSMSNAMVMSVLDRTGEIGTMMAIGTRRRDVLRLFLLEGLLLGLIGGVLGAVVGVALAKAISAIGIPMPPPPGREVGYRAEILVTTGIVASGLVLAALCAVLASAYPSWKAARLNVVDALRRNR